MEVTDLNADSMIRDYHDFDIGTFTDAAGKLSRDKGFLDSSKFVVSYVSSHAGALINGRVYDPGGMRRAISTWTTPYPKPITIGHPGQNMSQSDGESVTVGTVRKAEYVPLVTGPVDKSKYHLSGTWENAGTKHRGVGFERVYGQIDSWDAIERIRNQQLNRVSTGKMPAVDRKKGERPFVCSVCGSGISGGECSEGHELGTVDKESKQLVYPIMMKWVNAHLAHVHTPADYYAGVEEIHNDPDNDRVSDNLLAKSVRGQVRACVYALDGDNIYDMSHGGIFVQRDTRLSAILEDCLHDDGDLQGGGHGQAPFGIYPTGDDQLPEEVFGKVRDILGSRRMKAKAYAQLQDNAFVGPGRSWPAHNLNYVQAGLYLLETASDHLGDREREAIRYELLRRKSLMTQSDSGKKMEASEFARAHTIMSLDSAGCLASPDLLDDPSYVSLTSLLSEGKLSVDQLRLIRGSDGIGPNGSFPTPTEEHRVAALSLLDSYVGPVSREDLKAALLKPDGSSGGSTKQEQSKSQYPATGDGGQGADAQAAKPGQEAGTTKTGKEVNMDELIKALSALEGSEDQANQVLDGISWVAKAVEARVEAKTGEVAGAKDSEIESRDKRIEEIEGKYKSALADRLLDLKVAARLLKSDEVAGEFRDEHKKKLIERTFESLVDMISDLEPVALAAKTDELKPEDAGAAPKSEDKADDSANTPKGDTDGDAAPASGSGSGTPTPDKGTGEGASESENDSADKNKDNSSRNDNGGNKILGFPSFPKRKSAKDLFGRNKSKNAR